jgi:phage gpG-like protein
MSKFKFREKAQKFRSRKSAILEKMANNAVIYFKVDSFDKQSFDGRHWAPLKKPDGRQPLVKTGRMRQSITILKRTSDTRLVGSEVPYAGFQNRGTAHIPGRQFIGHSRELEAKNKAYLIQQTGNIL